MGLILSSIYWKLTKQTDTLDYVPNYVGTWKSSVYESICGEIELYMDLSENKIQALIIYDDKSVYRSGWSVKTDLELQQEDTASTSISHTLVDKSEVLATPDQKLKFAILERDESGKLSGSYTSTFPSDEGTWSVDKISSPADYLTGRLHGL